MYKSKQKQKDDLLFQIIKQGSPFKRSQHDKLKLIQKIKLFQLSQKQPHIEQHKQMIINKDKSKQLLTDMITPKKIQKRVTFIDHHPQVKVKRKQMVQVKYKLFDQKIKQQKQTKQVQKNIKIIQSKVQCLIDNLLNRKQSNKNLIKKENINLNSQNNSWLSLKSGLNSGLNSSIYSQNNQRKYRHESLVKNIITQQKQCQTVQLQSQPKEIIIKYRFQNQPNPESMKQQKIYQSTELSSSTNFNKITKYKDRPISLNKYENNQYGRNLFKTYSVSNLSINQSKLNSITPIRNKSVININQSKSQIFKFNKYQKQDKCRYQIDVEILKHKLIDKIDSSRKKFIK